MSKLAVTLSLVALACASSAHAAAYNFNVGYSGGGVATLLPGDDPTATNLAAGDTFTYRLLADPNDYWTVLAAGNLFPLFSLQTSDSGTRNANFTLKLYLDGVEQFSFSQANINNSFAHIGTNTVNLTPAGLQFDEFSLQYDLLASDNVNNRPGSLLPWPGQGPEQTFPNNIGYVDNVGVPEPASMALLALSLLTLAGIGRSRARH